MSTNRKILKVLSAVGLVCALASLVIGTIVLTACSLEHDSVMDIIAQNAVINFHNADTYQVLVGSCVALVIYAAWQAFVSIMGIRGANNPAKMGFVTVIAGISLVVNVIGIIAGIVAGVFSGAELITLVLYIALFYICFKVREEGKKA